MVNAGIFDGDQVLVKQQSTASDGDIVVALVDEGATVKTFYKEKGYYRLQPENDSMILLLFVVIFRYSEKYLAYSVCISKYRQRDDWGKRRKGAVTAPFCYQLFLEKFINIKNFSISPDSFQIIEKTVFFIKYMNDHIAVVHQNPA